MLKISIIPGKNGVEVTPVFLYTIMQNADYSRWSTDVVLLETEVTFTVQDRDLIIYKGINLEDIARGCRKLLTEIPSNMMVDSNTVDDMAPYVVNSDKGIPAKYCGYILQLTTLGKIFYP